MPETQYSLQERFITAKALCKKWSVEEAERVLNEIVLESTTVDRLVDLIEHLQNINDQDGIEAVYVKLIKIDPSNIRFSINFSEFLKKQRKLGEAVLVLRQATSRNIDSFEMHLSLAVMLFDAGLISDELLYYFSRAVQLNPTSNNALVGLGMVYRLLGEISKSNEILLRATEIRPDSGEAWHELAITRGMMGRIQEAKEFSFRAIAADPNNSEVGRALLYLLFYRQPDPNEIFNCHTKWAKRLNQEITPSFSECIAAPEKRLRIGLVSPDFKRHSVSYFIECLLQHMDRSQFELWAYSNLVKEDSRTVDFKRYFYRWRDIFSMECDQVVKQIRKDRIDFLFDLSGHTQHNRLDVFAKKPAPIQVSWIGYPGTTGLDTIDYRFTDALADPVGETDCYYTEKLWRLPQSFLCYTPVDTVPDVAEAPCLKHGIITFGSFNQRKKLSDDCIRLWANVLKAVPNSRMLVKSIVGLGEPGLRHEFRQLFEQEGVSGERILIDSAIGAYEKHLEKYSGIDIALDTIPYNGTTTTCEALWMGVPVITLAGNQHVSRVGVSLLTNAGLSDLIAQSEDEFVNIAVNLAGNFDKLSAIRKALRDSIKPSRLFNAKAMAQDVSDALRSMWRDYCSTHPSALIASSPAVSLEELPKLVIGRSSAADGWELFYDEEKVGVDYVGDMAKLERFCDESYSRIYCDHIVQRLPLSDIPGYIHDLHRMLAPGGELYLSVPNMDALNWLLTGPHWTTPEKFELMRFLFGKQVDQYDFNKAGLSHDLMMAYLKNAGFSEVSRVASFEQFENSNLLINNAVSISLNLIAYKSSL